MISTETDQEYYSVGQAASLKGMQTWMVQSMIRRNLLPALPKFGRYHMIPQDLLPTLEAVGQACGYLPRGKA